MQPQDLVVEYIRVRILDIPTIRPHKLSFGTIQRQSPVIVELRLTNGVYGYGEAATIGGPSWNEESPESIYHAVISYLAPAIKGQNAGHIETLLARMDLACRGNWFAKSAVEMALFDALARSLDIPAWQLLGGKQRDSMPLAWTLASGDIQKDVEEAQRYMQAGRHNRFKIKIGARSPSEDVTHVCNIARELKGQASLTVDVNQAWDGNTAHRWLPNLVDAGIHLIEQPVAKWNVEALASLSSLHNNGLIMADESVATPQEAMILARGKACHVFSLKVAKHGGLLRTRKVAAIAEASDIGWYGGTMLETSLGSAASAHVFSTLPSGGYGCELLGPYLLVEDIVQKKLEVHNFELQIPDGPGFGIEIDKEKLDAFDRANAGLERAIVDFGRTTQATQ